MGRRLVGATLKRYFTEDGIWHRGKVEDYRSPYYLVVYEDGDREDLVAGDLNNNNPAKPVRWCVENAFVESTK